MNILYCRVSTLDQKTDRQRVDEKDFKKTIEDRCSGAIPFFERPGGKEIQNLINKEAISSLSVWSIDRLGRNLRDIINTIHVFTSKSICIHFLSQGLKTLESNGKENPIAKMMISILGIVAEMEKAQIRERQLEGIKIAVLKGVYKGRAKGSKENVLDFLSKPSNSKALALLNKGYRASEVAKITELHPNTITKIKKLGLNNQPAIKV